MGKGKKQVTITFPAGLIERLDKFCKDHYDAERSTVVTTAVEKFLDEGGKK